MFQEENPVRLAPGSIFELKIPGPGFLVLRGHRTRLVFGSRPRQKHIKTSDQGRTISFPSPGNSETVYPQQNSTINYCRQAG